MTLFLAIVAVALAFVLGWRISARRERQMNLHCAFIDWTDRYTHGWAIGQAIGEHIDLVEASDDSPTLH